MAVAIVTGSGGLIGSEAAAFFHSRGFDVCGIDNDSRGYFFGLEASTRWKVRELEQTLPNYTHHTLDIRDKESIFQLFKSLGREIAVVIHAAAQPSHDWAAQEPFTDFTINANGTLVMLEAVRQHSPESVFIFTSTNKVYGDTPNRLPLVELETRWEVAASHPYFENGIDETMSIDDSLHSLFGVSKVAADLMVQEYSRYFGLKTGVFRGGCLTGPAHSGAELHGFLAYLVKCAITGKTYTVNGYKGKQVRDNIHSNDLINAFWCFFKNPNSGQVYNIGGSRANNCSILEAVGLIEKLTGRAVQYNIAPPARIGDHIWWVSDVAKFRSHYPEWEYGYDLSAIISEIVEALASRH